MKLLNKVWYKFMVFQYLHLRNIWYATIAIGLLYLCYYKHWVWAFGFVSGITFTITIALLSYGRTKHS